MARSIAAEKRYAEKRKGVNTTVAMPKELRDKLKSCAESEGITMVELIEKLLQIYV